MAARLDYYDILPAGMEAYLSNHGRHISKPMLEWAVSMMEDRRGNKGKVLEKKEFDELMKAYSQKLSHNEGYYDGPYVWAMAKSDYFGSSIIDEQHLAMYVKDYIDDIDGNPTRAFDELYINCVAKGIDIPWKDLI
ncbi:MAG: hypothetical protein II661_04920 [Bacteroidales bacterium]|nr:hypothetical protein [Bacteroidales bacterium]